MHRYQGTSRRARASAYPAHADRTELKMHVVTQQTPVWCWAATASMALQQLGFADINPGRNYQCGVVAAAFPVCDDDCTKCVTSLKSMEKFVRLLDRYRDLSREAAPGPSKLFSPNYVANPRWNRIKHSLDLSFPVIAGISPDGRPADPGESQHTVLITGYDDDYRGTGEDWVIIRDPYPYEGAGNPYSDMGYRFDTASGRAQLPWRVLRDRLNLTSAVFLEKRSA
jgi:Peptidase_C39 like family